MIEIELWIEKKTKKQKTNKQTRSHNNSSAGDCYLQNGVNQLMTTWLLKVEHDKEMRLNGISLSVIITMIMSLLIEKMSLLDAYLT